MSKKSDDSIERIFRQVLTQYDDASSTIKNDWMKMEQMLVEEERRLAAIRSKRNKGIAFTVAALIGLLTGVYFLSFRNPSPSIAKHEVAPNETQVSAGEDNDGIGNVPTNADNLLSTDTADNIEQHSLENEEKLSTDDLHTDEVDASMKNDQANGHDRLVKGDEYSSNKFQSREPRERREAQLERSKGLQNAPATSLPPATNQHLRTDRGGVIPNEKRATESIERSTTKNKQVDNGEVVRKNDDSPVLLETADGEEFKNGEGPVVSEKKEKIDAVTDSSQDPAQAAALGADSLSVDRSVVSGADSVNTPETITDASDRSVLPFHRLSIALLFSPEFSATTMSGYSRPGESYGLRIGYQITRRFGISTAIIRSRKKYTGSGYDYKPVNPAYWDYRTNGVIPEEIDGRCLIYEVPVTIRYDVMQSAKSNVFASAGISSFFMASQLYEYSFDQPNPGADTEWSTSRMENYWFSSLMISAGYERNVGNSWAIGIEPYLKMTLSEIGWPNVKLFSTGGYVTLRYKFMMKQR